MTHMYTTRHYIHTHTYDTTYDGSGCVCLFHQAKEPPIFISQKINEDNTRTLAAKGFASLTYLYTHKDIHIGTVAGKRLPFLSPPLPLPLFPS